MVTVPKEYLVEIDGKPFVRYAGLLQMAHEEGLKALTTDVLAMPRPGNGGMAVVRAAATMKDGRAFSDCGDASPASVGDPALLPHLLRIASTRAKARALRDALGIGITALEELSLGDLERGPAAGPVPARATPAQLQVLRVQAEALGLPPQEIQRLATLTTREASDRITCFNKALKARKAG